MTTYLLKHGDAWEAALKAKKEHNEKSEQEMANEAYHRARFRKMSVSIEPRSNADMLEAEEKRAELARRDEKIMIMTERMMQLEKALSEEKAKNSRTSAASMSTEGGGVQTPKVQGGALALQAPQSPFFFRATPDHKSRDPESIVAEWDDEDVSFWLVSKMPYIGARELQKRRAQTDWQRYGEIER